MKKSADVTTPISLVPMTEQQYLEYARWSMANYAKDLTLSEGMNGDDARKMAQETFAKFLPNGLRTENQFLYTIHENRTDSMAGVLWWSLRKTGKTKVGFLSEIYLDPSYQGFGYGKWALYLFEKEARSLGAHYLRLHVFGHNSKAIGFYNHLGWTTTNIMMQKSLAGEELPE